MNSLVLAGFPEVSDSVMTLEAIEFERSALDQKCHEAKSQFTTVLEGIGAGDLPLQRRLALARWLYWSNAAIPSEVISESLLRCKHHQAIKNKMYEVELPCRCPCGAHHQRAFSSKASAKDYEFVRETNDVCQEFHYVVDCRPCLEAQAGVYNDDLQRISTERNERKRTLNAMNYIEFLSTP